MTVRDLLSFSFPFDSISNDDKRDLHDCYMKLIEQMPKTIQFKLNAGINVGTFNTSALWNITDISDDIFFKYISDKPMMLRDAIESHLSKCVISNKDNNGGAEVKQMPQQTKAQQKTHEQKPESKDNILTIIVRRETLERIRSGEKTTFKRYLDDEEFAKEVLVTENGKIKFSSDHCPYTAKNITSIKLVCDNESIVKKPIG